MPDFVILILAFVGSIWALLNLICKFGLAEDMKPEECPSGFCVFVSCCIPLILWLWFIIGATQDWNPPYQTETYKVLTYKHATGYVTQYIEGNDPEVGIRQDGLMPEGTTYVVKHYDPWQCGIRWSSHEIANYVTPPTTQTQK